MFHPWHDIPVNPDTLEEGFDVVIEVPRGSKVKYELDKESGLLRVDRILHSSVVYPANYGFIPRSYCDDKDPLDVLVVGSEIVAPNVLMNVRAVGVMHMIDGGEQDDKIIAVHADDPFWRDCRELEDLPAHIPAEIVRFFQDYKLLEKKSVIVESVEGRVRALEVLRESFDLYARNEAALRG